MQTFFHQDLVVGRKKKSPPKGPQEPLFRVNLEKPLNVAFRLGKEDGYVSLYFSKTDDETRRTCTVHELVLGCRLLVDPGTGKFRVLHIPIPSLGCDLWDTADSESLQLDTQLERGTDCFVVTLRSLLPTDRVKAELDYMDSVIFDTLDGKLVRIEIIGASQFLDV